MPRASIIASPAVALFVAAPLVLQAGQDAREQHSSTLSAVDDSTPDEIVVIAHKAERSVRDIAANVTVITRERLQADLASTVADVFRYTPGIDYEASGSRFGTEGVNIRGIGGNRVAMLVDGVPLSDQFDIGSFSNAIRSLIDAGLVERIEVLHGPASVLYGSAAIGGVVALRTPDPSQLLHRDSHGGEATFTWRGADQSTDATGLAAFGSDSLGVLVGGSLRNGHEIDPATVQSNADLRDFDQRSAIFKLVTDDDFGNTLRIALIGQASDVTSEQKSMLGSGRFRSTTALLGDDSYRLGLLTMEYEFGGADSRVDAGVLRAYYESAEVDQHTVDERGLAGNPVSIDRHFVFDQRTSGAELNLHKYVEGKVTSHDFGFGLEYRERDTAEFRDGLSTSMVDGVSTNVILGEVFPLRDFPLSESTEWGAYVEDVVAMGDWSLIGAVRVDRYALTPSSDPIYAEDYPFAEIVSIEAHDVSPNLGLIYRFGPHTEAYAQYTHGFRAPPYEDANIGLEIPFFNYRAIPNPQLRSETSNGFDAGIRWRSAAGGARISAFRTRFTDFIESRVRVGTDPDSGRILFQSQNLNATVIEGIEAGAHITVRSEIGEFLVDGSFYVARGENRENGEPLNSVGPAQAVVGASWTAENGMRQVRLQSTYTEAWDERDETTGELFKPPGHAVFDLYYTHRLGKQTTFRAGLLNLTDRSYWNWSDVRGLEAGDPVLPYLAQPGRSLSIGVNLVWQ